MHKGHEWIEMHLMHKYRYSCIQKDELWKKVHKWMDMHLMHKAPMKMPQYR